MKKIQFETIRQSEKLTKKKVLKAAFEWIQAGVEDNFTRDKNIQELNKIKILPRFLKKIINANTGSNFFGTTLSHPILLAPMGHQTQWHKNGEIEMAKGLSSPKTIAFFSTQGRIRLKEIRQKNKKIHLGWEIFPFGNKEWILKQIEEATKYNCLAICLCVDANIRSHRYQDREVKYGARKYGRMGRNHSLPPDITFALKYDWNLISWIKKKTKRC